MRPSVIAALAIGLVSIGLAAVKVLASSPLIVAGTNSVSTSDYLILKNGFDTCQPTGTIPQGTVAIRVSIEGGSVSPAVTIKILKHSRVFREGQRVGGLGPIPNVTVPVERLSQAVYNARICTTVRPTTETVRYVGMLARSPAHRGDRRQNMMLGIEYLRPGPTSWWSLMPSIIRHIGFGHEPHGTWTALLVVALMLAVVVTVSLLTLKELR